MKLRNVIVALSAVLIGTATPGFAQAARSGGGHGGGGSHMSGGRGGGGHWNGGRGYRGGYGGFGVGLGVGLLGAAIAAPYVADPNYYYGQPYYAPPYPANSPYGYGYGGYDPYYSDPYASNGYGYTAGDPNDPRY
jgi:hypothetical protein